MSNQLPSPSVLLGIPNYDKWRTNQDIAFQAIMDWYSSDKRYIGMSMPTGSGKTICALLTAKMTGARTVILTATKGLQDQYLFTGQQLGMVSVKGQNNFSCQLVPGLRADEGPCKEGLNCEYRVSGCRYREQLNKALGSQLIVTNYSYYLAQTKFSSGLGDIGLVVCTPEYTKVTLSDGSQLPIKTIVDGKLRLKVKSVDLSTGELVDSCISGWQRVECKVNLLHIQTSTGSFDVTADHSVWTNRGYVQAGNLRVGDVVYGYSSVEPGAIGGGESVGRCEFYDGEARGRESEIAHKSFMETKGFGGCQVQSPCRLGRESSQEDGEWRMGSICLPFCDSVNAGTDAVLQVMLPEWSPHSVTRMARFSGCAGDGLVASGQWKSGTSKQECFYCDALVWGRGESSCFRLVTPCLRCDKPCDRRQSRTGVLFNTRPKWERQISGSDSSFCGCQYVVQGRLCDSYSDMPCVWQVISQFPRSTLLFSRMSEDRAATTGSRLVYAEVTRIGYVERPDYVYDITVDKTHNFFADGHLVRNCDEGHLAFSAVENFMQIHLSRQETESLGLEFPRGQQDWSFWQAWASANLDTVSDAAKDMEAQVKSARQNGDFVPSAQSRILRSYRATTHHLTSMSTATGKWVVQAYPHGWQFTPVWIKDYNQLLPQSSPKMMLMSALLSEKTLDILGIPTAERKFFSIGSSFPPQNTPIWHIPTARINYQTDNSGTAIWLARIDQIISRRLDRKGIIFTVSYARRDLILRRSQHSGLMMSHSTRDVVEMVRRFREAPAPCVFVSPSITSGYDVPEADYIIAGKLAYPDTTDAVLKARQEEDDEWSSFLAMDTMINELGRGTRSAEDKTECFIIDDSWKWFYPRFRKYTPLWFQQRVRGSLNLVPNPLI